MGEEGLSKFPGLRDDYRLEANSFRTYAGNKTCPIVIGRHPAGFAAIFKDRERQQQKITKLLTDPSTRLINIIGHSGIGKSALACKILHDIENGCLISGENSISVDGIVYFSPRTNRVTIQQIFSDCSRMLRSPQGNTLKDIWQNRYQTIGEKIAQLFEILRTGFYIMLFDNVEDLLNENDEWRDGNLQIFFEHAVSSSHGVRVILTSRRRPRLFSDLRHDTTSPIRLDKGLDTEDGIALLRESDPDGNYGIRDSSHDVLENLVSLVHGYPLGCNIIKGILDNDPLCSLNDIIDRFYQEKDVIRSLLRERYKGITFEARMVIDALAVLKRPVQLEAVAFLLEPFLRVNPLPKRGILARLVRADFVKVNRGTKNLELLPIDQDYALRELEYPNSDRPDGYSRRALELRAAAYYAQVHVSPDHRKSLIDVEPQLCEFEHLFNAGECEAAVKVLLDIDPWLRLWGHYNLAREKYEQLYGKIKNPELDMNSSTALGLVRFYLGQIREAMVCFERALMIATQSTNSAGEQASLCHLGLCYTDLGQTHKAIEYLGRALKQAVQSNDLRAQGVCRGNLASCYFDIGQTQLAMTESQDAFNIALHPEVDDPEMGGAWLITLGNCHAVLGEFNVADEYFQKALEILCYIKDREDEAMVLHSRAEMAFGRGVNEVVLQYAGNGLDISKQIGSPRSIIQNAGVLALAHLCTGNIKDAAKYAKLCMAYDIPQLNHRASLVMGLIRLQQGDTLLSRKLFQLAQVQSVEVLNQCRDNLKALDTKWLSLSGLVLCENEHLAASAKEAFLDARAINADFGYMQSIKRIFDLLEQNDSTGQLQGTRRLLLSFAGYKETTRH